MTRQLFTGWLSGAIFGVGLLLSGMTDPANIQGFLDFFGRFRPNLALVMVGAILVHALALRARSSAAPASIIPGRRIDAPLLFGAAVFGAGWGLGGYCPGPSLVALGAGNAGALVFVVASVLGMLLADVQGAWLGGGRASATEKDAAETG